jgi:hypothetical protein
MGLVESHRMVQEGVDWMKFHIEHGMLHTTPIEFE